MNARNLFFLGTTACAMAVATTGCDVNKTDDGSKPDVTVAYEKGQLPKYEVEKTQEGKMPDVDVDVDSGSLPTYEVETPSVDVGKKDVDVSVPNVDVSMEKKKVTIPDVDVTMPGEDDDDQ